LKKNILGVKNRFFDKNALFFIVIRTKSAITFFQHGQIFSVRRHFTAKFYGKQFCRTSLFREKSSKRLKIDFFAKNPSLHWIRIKSAIIFFLHGQIFFARRHFAAKFYGEQLCRASLFRKNSSKRSKIDFLAKNPALHWIRINSTITFFLHSQIFSARRHFAAKFYWEQLCRTSLFRENASKRSKIDFLAKNCGFKLKSS